MFQKKYIDLQMLKILTKPEFFMGEILNILTQKKNHTAPVRTSLGLTLQSTEYMLFYTQGNMH